MHPDKWPEIKERILSNFEILEHDTFKNEERKEDTEYLEFKGPMGIIRLEWVTRPKVLGKKTSYSNRIGGDVAVDYNYSEEEFTHTIHVYRWNEQLDDWQEIDNSSFV